MNQMNLSALRVTVCFEFANVTDPDCDAVSETLELLAEDIELTRRAHDADAAWIDDVSIVAGGHEVEASTADSDLKKTLELALYTLNMTPRFNVPGAPNGLRDSYQVCAAIERVLRVESGKATPAEVMP